MRTAVALVGLVATLLGATGCDGGFQKVDPGYYGVVFADLPTFLGGGLSERVLEPGEMEFVFPWQTLYRIRTTRQTIGWGGVGQGDNTDREDYVETRTLDGNEVGLAISVDYRINPERIHHIIQKVGTRDEAIRQLMSAVARADIRTQMNSLRTGDFFDPVKRQEAVERVKTALNSRLEREGIIVEAVIYLDHRFERRLPNGGIDRRYQEQIDETQRFNQETLQEQKKIETVKEAKNREFNEVKATVNRVKETAEGEKRQAVLRGDAALNTQRNAAEQITAVGMAEVEGLRKQIEALSGPGGKALLRLQVVRELIAGGAKFVVVNSSGAKGGVELNRMDTNELLRQAGVFAVNQEVARETSARAPQEAITLPTPPVTPPPAAATSQAPTGEVAPGVQVPTP